MLDLFHRVHHWNSVCTHRHSDQTSKLLTHRGNSKTETGAAACWILPPQTKRPVLTLITTTTANVILMERKRARNREK